MRGEVGEGFVEGISNGKRSERRREEGINRVIE